MDGGIKLLPRLELPVAFLKSIQWCRKSMPGVSTGQVGQGLSVFCIFTNKILLMNSSCVRSIIAPVCCNAHATNRTSDFLDLEQDVTCSRSVHNTSCSIIQLYMIHSWAFAAPLSFLEAQQQPAGLHALKSTTQRLLHLHLSKKIGISENSAWHLYDFVVNGSKNTNFAASVLSNVFALVLFFSKTM